MTKDKIRLSALHFCRRACFLFSNLMSDTLKWHFSYNLLRRCSVLLARFFILEAELLSSDKKIIPLSEEF